MHPFQNKKNYYTSLFHKHILFHFIARLILERLLYHVDWLTIHPSIIHLGVVIRCLVQLTIDITNLATLLDSPQNLSSGLPPKDQGASSINSSLSTVITATAATTATEVPQQSSSSTTTTTTTKNIQRVHDYILCFLHTIQKKDSAMSREEFCKLLFEETEAELDWFITLCWNVAVFASTVKDFAHSCFFWYSVFLFSTLSSPSNEILEIQRHSLTFTVATFLRIHHTAEKVLTEELTLPKCVSLIATCREVVNAIQSANGSSTIVEETNQYLHFLEIACLVRMESPMLLPKLKELNGSCTPSTMYSFYLNIYHLLEEEHCSNMAAKKECLRSAFQILLQQPTFALEQVGEVIYHLIQVCESKSEEFHWVEQFLQIAKTRGENVK